jgi:hypothetical protein
MGLWGMAASLIAAIYDRSLRWPVRAIGRPAGPQISLIRAAWATAAAREGWPSFARMLAT